MKNLLIIAGVALLSINLLFACGGMTPAAAPSSVSTTVPDLPSDSTGDIANPTGDVTNTTGDVTNTTGDGTSLEDVDSNLNNLNDLSSDLPQDKVQSTVDGDFVPAVL